MKCKFPQRITEKCAFCPIEEQKANLIKGLQKTFQGYFFKVLISLIDLRKENVNFVKSRKKTQISAKDHEKMQNSSKNHCKKCEICQKLAV